MGTIHRCGRTGRRADDGVDVALPEIRGRTGEDNSSERAAEVGKQGGIDKVYCNTHFNLTEPGAGDWSSARRHARGSRSAPRLVP